MTIFLWIRHGEKEYKNGKNPLGIYQHDPGIIETEYDVVRKKGLSYIKKYGIPDLIYVSPFKRTRITSNLLTQSLIDPKIIIEPELGEFLGNQKKRIIDDVESFIPDVETETLENLETFLEESYSDFKNRCIVTASKIHSKKEKVIWIITHSLIIKTISSYYGCKISKPLSLCGIVIRIDKSDGKDKKQIKLLN